MKPTLYITELDAASPKFAEMLKENFRLLEKFLSLEPFINGEFKHYELVFTSAISDYDFQHRCTFVPKDIITTFISNSASVTWKYNSFDRTNIRFSTSDACTLRFFVGRYRKEVGAQ